MPCNPLEADQVAAFLRDYWQKKPLLVRDALPGIRPPLDADELAGLACEHGVNARLIENHGEADWQVDYGPFSPKRLEKLPPSGWSLLVSDMESLLPEAATLLERFRFIPDWRIDDLMISLAPPGGSVGAHTDAYDVFLVQLGGVREWRISEHFDPATLDDCPLSILQNFEAEQVWRLRPGDMLYLPPGVAHHGIAVESDDGAPCMTASIGFRAPAINTLVVDFADRMAESIDDALLYTDPDLAPQAHPAEISPVAIEKIRQHLQQALTLDSERVQRWFGEYCSERKAGFLPPDEPLQHFDPLDKAWRREPLHPASGLKFFHSPHADGENAWLFVDGHSHLMPLPLARALCARPVEHAACAPLLDDANRTLILQLYNEGCLTFEPWQENGLL